MPGPVRTVIGHGRILAHPNLPVETLSSSLVIEYGDAARSIQRASKILYAPGPPPSVEASAGSV